MSSKQETIKSILSFILSNGDRFKATFYLGATPIDYPQITVDNAKRQSGDLISYIDSLVNELNPDRLVIVVKKPNGNSGGKDPVTKVFDFSESKKEIEKPSNPYQDKPSLEGINSKSYDFHLDILKEQNSELKQELKEYKQEGKAYKKAFRKIKSKYETQQERYNLERKTSEISNQNSLAGVLKEAMPAIKEVAKEYMLKKGNTTESPVLEGITDERISALIELIKHLEGEQLSFYYEVLVRMAQLTKEELPSFLESLREKTQQVNELFTQN
jgi:hypothetical protein